ncbi:leucine-rich repeat protein kinase family protein [Striga asiatica]|uniref:Leucine-rich repeat protein kinase family protein n=1 Tax=Striga asiatica TaxID=4170 RepID=A0A5A7Q6P8_STRAF|nr:leucine-rich repeat protein kinase family protein [Striga asiatica]
MAFAAFSLLRSAVVLSPSTAGLRCHPLSFVGRPPLLFNSTSSYAADNALVSDSTNTATAATSFSEHPKATTFERAQRLVLIRRREYGAATVICGGLRLSSFSRMRRSQAGVYARRPQRLRRCSRIEVQLLRCPQNFCWPLKEASQKILQALLIIGPVTTLALVTVMYSDSWPNVGCDENNLRVTQINLYNTKLSGTLAPELGNLTNLQSLYVVHAYIIHSQALFLKMFPYLIGFGYKEII